MASVITTLIRWTMSTGGFVALLFPFWLASHFADHVGPILRYAVFKAGFATVVALGVGLYSGARSDAVSCWRSLCLSAAIPLLALVYCGTGDRWVMDRVNALRQAEEGLRNWTYSPEISSGQNAVWHARLKRDFDIAKANSDYDGVRARSGGVVGRPVASGILVACGALGVILVLGALVPRRWIENAAETVTGLSLSRR
jgi:hypothetical protein